MGRLSGFRYRDITRKLRRLGFRYVRSAKSSHEIWEHPETRRRTVLVNHPGELPDGTLRSILELAGVVVEDFLAA